MKCKFCGRTITDDSVFCDYCGRKIISDPEPKAAKPKAAEPKVAEPKVAEPNAPKPVHKPADKPVQSGPKFIPHPSISKLPTKSGTTKLWQQLAQEQNRTAYYTDKISEISSDDFGLALQKKLDGDGIPARVENADISWDETGVNQKRLIISPNNIPGCPTCFFVGLDRIGKYTFIEDKTVIYPPDLPAAPGDTVPVPEASTRTALIAVALLIAGLLVCFSTDLKLLGIGAIVFGVIIMGYYISACGKESAAEEHNRAVAEAERVYEKAWTTWENTNLLAAYLSSTDDMVGRTYEAYRKTIAKVCEELFKNQAGQTTTEKITQNEIRQSVEKRRASFR